MNRNDRIVHERPLVRTRTQFVRTLVLVFGALSLVLFSIDFVPESRSSTTVPSDTSHSTSTTGTISSPVEIPASTEPVRISIERIGVETPIMTPASTDIAVLDRALLSGAVHYPGSAEAGVSGNMLIFGHSSYLPVVKNQAFKAFNELSKLDEGDTIDVYTTTHRFTYAVRTVDLMKAEDAIVPLTVSEPTLTLATCNTFGAKQERWVVVGHLIATTPL